MSATHAGWSKVVLASLLLLGCARPPVVGPILPSAPSGAQVPGALEWPVRGALVSPYRPPSRPSHAGVDLAAPPGSLVISAEAGDVVYAGEIRGYDRVIAVRHAGELTTVYAHLGEVRVAEGRSVARGEAIGTVGVGGYLHYEIRRAKQPIDPAELYAMGPSLDPQTGGASSSAGIPEEPASDVPLGPAAEPAPPAPQPDVAVVPRASDPFDESGAREVPPDPAPRRASGGTLGSDLAPQEDSTVTPTAAGGDVPFPFVVGANLLYVPAKLAYAGVGAVTGTFVLALSQDTAVANRVWGPTLGGDYFVASEHLSGERGVHFMGESTD